MISYYQLKKMGKKSRGGPKIRSKLSKTDNNLSCLLYSRLPSFFIFLCIFLGQNAYNTNFLPIFTNFSHFDHFDALFRASLLFFNFFFNWWYWLSIQEMKFIMTLVIFCDKMVKISILTNFWPISAYFWTILA